jgi:hypothetical protein
MWVPGKQNRATYSTTTTLRMLVEVAKTRRDSGSGAPISQPINMDAIEDAAVAGMNDGCEKAFSKPELGSNDELLQTYQSFQC